MRKTIDRLFNPDLMTERLESLKAGIFAAVAVVSTYWLVTLLIFLMGQSQYNLYLPPTLVLNRLDIGNAILTSFVAIASGFLFGATYRYVVRNDTNPHLQSGAIMAFGLVRGMAQLEVNLSNLKVEHGEWGVGNAENNPLLMSLWRVLEPLASSLNIIAIALMFGESVIWFASAGLILDLAMEWGWVKRFAGES